ncbi:hypothetical protein A3C25_05400 [Candidatus Roizmanbacteria bacterium RIFCSPHIGHO2_02_FULL_38_11]|uniref:Peptidase M28 domain-containing protein n=1 Tax=Candidatus Roizmanbacteria bacterium RIFCSPHIGHO2_02_FULL_38_11 TaxID=1802039 RepID=A0A1F7GYE3_9BACT|nr:MAG: hypothetical protein A3C25_05400 [Candidatus Roizmanbacteria bacterium RIFCSPHIGHO2_02_FULL_38_11]
MKIVLSAHFDLARPVMSIKMDDKNLLGLVDNFAGIFTSYQASRKTGIPVYFTNYEELEFDGAVDVAKSLDKDTLVIVVDTTIDAEDKPAYIGNVYGFSTEPLKKLFSDRIFFKDGMYEKTEDETVIYGAKYGLKTFYFGVPIPNPHAGLQKPFPKPGSYHTTDNKISLEAIDKVSSVLVDLIEWFSKNDLK